MQTLLKALLALVLSCSSLSSETIYGTGTTTAHEWVMSNVIPNALGLKINGVYHKYTITKDAASNATVTICNKNIDTDGCAYMHTDNWDGLPSSTKIYYDPVNLSAATLGDGSIELIGEGVLSDPLVYYDYYYDTCSDPISDPGCPGYEATLLKYITDNNLFEDPDVNDPYYNDFVQAQIKAKAELDKEEETTEEIVIEKNKEEETLEEMLTVGGDMRLLVDPIVQTAAMTVLSNAPALEPYYALEIDGGEYRETLVLPDNELVDNTRALRSLQTDANHRKMVRAQYDK